MCLILLNTKVVVLSFDCAECPRVLTLQCYVYLLDEWADMPAIPLPLLISRVRVL